MYHLLPFRFTTLLNKSTELIVNEVGDYLLVPSGTVSRIVQKQLSTTEELYKDLIASFFISSDPIPKLIDIYATRLRTKKSFLDAFTSLHIFVLTLRCNQNCIYCQASSKECLKNEYDIKIADLKSAIDLMFQSPSSDFTMEFQGGESSLVPDLLLYAINYSKERNIDQKKRITYVLCTNLIDVNDNILYICKEHNILISTSLDGPEYLHNKNRGKNESYKKVVEGIKKCRNVLGIDKVSALMTTAIDSLKYPTEIVDCYITNGFKSIFLRPLNPYGYTNGNVDWDDYIGQFINFYKIALAYIIDINKKGFFFVEEFTTILLQKILTPFSVGFVDLQSPSGIINSVAVYNYDGYVYASDESRMLAEQNDLSFRLGHVSEEYSSIFYGKKAQELAKIWCTEYIAGCSDCVFLSYCGADPVRNHTLQGDSYGFRPNSLFCKKHKAILYHIFSLIDEKEQEVMPIFKSWIRHE